MYNIYIIMVLWLCEPAQAQGVHPVLQRQLKLLGRPAVVGVALALRELAAHRREYEVVRCGRHELRLKGQLS